MTTDDKRKAQVLAAVFPRSVRETLANNNIILQSIQQSHKMRVQSRAINPDTPYNGVCCPLGAMYELARAREPSLYTYSEYHCEPLSFYDAILWDAAVERYGSEENVPFARADLVAACKQIIQLADYVHEGADRRREVLQSLLLSADEPPTNTSVSDFLNEIGVTANDTVAVAAEVSR